MEKKIIIHENGPLEVKGNIPLNELVIEVENGENKYVEGKTFEVGDTYFLCRCGNSKNAPFCDGSHVKTKFDGTLNAPKKKDDFGKVVYEGETLVLEDYEPLCAYARFCHNDDTDIWSAAENDDIENAKRMACNCPAGRLVLKNKITNEEYEEEFEPSISIIQDPNMKCSGPLFIKGKIEVVDDKGNVYETGNRATLCRCGKSEIKPFCDASHVNTHYDDKLGVENE